MVPFLEVKLMDNSRQTRQGNEPEGRRPYTEPRLTVHGTLAQLTQGLRYADVPENDYSNQWKSSSGSSSSLFF